MTPLECAKNERTIHDIAPQYFPDWVAGRSCKSPFRDDRHPSFSVYDDGRKWKDHATGERGDVIDFICKARGCKQFEAARELIAWAGIGAIHGRYSGHRATTKPSELSVAAKPLAAMPAGCRAIWTEGLSHLLDSERMQRQIDTWRHWTPGTSRQLAEDGLMGCPIYRGRRQTAFAVQSPIIDELGCISTTDVGYHVRLKPRNNERPLWLYQPAKQRGTGCPALPFVLGGGFVPYATTIIATEGQWDAITLVSAAGWLASDATWPEGILVFGTRGADGWRALLDAWGRHWRAEARFVLFPDADEAGDRWTASRGFADALRTRGHYVRIVRSNEPAAKDLNDMHRRQPLTPDEISRWVTGKRTNAMNARSVVEQFEPPPGDAADLESSAGLNGTGHVFPGDRFLDGNRTPSDEVRAGSALVARAIALDLDPAHPPPEDRPIFYINDKVVSTASNLSALTGRAKTAKTTIVGAHVAACMVAHGRGKAEADTLGISSSSPGGKAVLIVDTEQSPAHASEQLRRTLERVGLSPAEKPEWLHVLPLAGWAAGDLTAVLPGLLEAFAARHNGIHSVFLDGGADFACDVNSPAEAANLVSSWHALAIQYTCALLAVIHSNESRTADDIARGWLGKQLRRKAESNLTVKRDGEFLILFGEDGQRHAPILERDGPRFTWSSDAGMHVSCESARTKHDVDDKAGLRELAADCFAESPSGRMRYTDLVQLIKKAAKVKERAAEGKIARMRKHGILREGGLRLLELVA